MSNYSDEQKKAIIKSNEEARKAMLKNILTAEQFAKLEKSVSEQRQIVGAFFLSNFYLTNFNDFNPRSF